MRLVILVDDHAFLKPRLLETLLLALKHDTVLVAGVSRFKQDKSMRGNFRLFGFWGFRGALAIAGSMIAGMSTQLLGLSESPTSLAGVCREFEVPFLRVADINDSEFVTHVAALEPDVIVSFQHQIFRASLLKTAKIASLNCHPSDLPKYRGVMPLFWARLANEKEFAVTVHTMTDEIDQGRVVAKKFFPNLTNVSLLQHYRWAYIVAAQTIIDAISAIKGRPVEDFPPMEQGAAYYKAPTPKDRQEYLNRGFKIV